MRCIVVRCELRERCVSARGVRPPVHACIPVAHYSSARRETLTMTDWSPVQRVWPNYEPYHYDMFPGYQQMLPGTVPHNLPVQQYIQENQNMPVSQSMPVSQCLPIQQNLPLSPNLMPTQYYFEQPNMPMSQNFSMPEEYPMMQHAQMQNYTTEQYSPLYKNEIYQSVPMTQNSMISSTLSSPEYMTDPASAPLPDDIPLPQNVPLPEDVSMPQYVDESSEFSMPTTSGYNMLHSSPRPLSTAFMPPPEPVHPPRKQDNPREIRNKAEKQRRDKLNRSIADLASMVPPVVAASRKIDKTGVLRLTAHYLRAHEYVFGDSLAKVAKQQFKSSSLRAVLGLFNGFLLTVTYKGIIVVVSENVQQYLGYTELELLGHNILSITHEDDRQMMMKQLMPKKEFLGPNGELLIPDEPDGIMKITEALGREKRKFILRLKKLGQRSEPDQYIRCHVEGSFRKSDKACVGSNRCCQVVRRARARTENHCTSGNDVVFIGVVRPEAATFITEIGLESSRMEYRTRHSIDGEIIQCEQRIALVTGYMIHEVQGVNAMNFMHKDDVHWVIIALREMYDEHRLYGESCYRLMTKNGDFIYMRTRGRLDVDNDSRVVTSFVCTNTVVDEAEGKHLIKMMKKNFNTQTKKEGELLRLMDKEESDKKDLPVEHPRQLEKVILHLVTNLPSQGEDNVTNKSFISGASTSRRLEIIPPKKERIVSAIEKIYSVMTFPKEHHQEELLAITEDEEKQAEDLNAPGTSQNNVKVTEISSDDDSNFLKSELDKISEQDNMYLLKQLEDSVQMPTTSVCIEPQYTNFDLMTQPIEPTQYNMMTPLEVDDYFKVKLCYPEVNQTRVHTAVEFECQVVKAPEVQKNKTKNQMNQETLKVTLPSSSKASLKRPNECLERNIIKKKLSNMSHDSENDTYPDDDFSCLEALFDDEMLDKQIESTIHSLEQSIDPTFPDLLISNEVQEILQEIEGGQNANSARV